ncbi:MAG TPA: hypothetical protein VMH03_08370 [Terriglobales bacterium]|nr:hypothetical protein [Terriglobales bacterium]
MNALQVISTAILSLLLGIAAPAYAQHEQQGEKQDHPQQQQSKHAQAKPEPQHAQQQRQPEQKQQHAQQPPRQEQNRQQHAQQQQRQSQNRQQQRAQQQRQDQSRQQEHARQQRSPRPAQRTPEQQRVQQSAWRQHGSQHWDSDHRTWQQRGGYHGYRIPDARFRGYFGPSHGFRIYGLPFLVVGGYPRFQYQGYWFSPVDPWPEYWGDNWYDNDEVYVAYVDNGYYLYNNRYPNVGIAISISM